MLAEFYDHKIHYRKQIEKSQLCSVNCPSDHPKSSKIQQYMEEETELNCTWFCRKIGFTQQIANWQSKNFKKKWKTTSEILKKKGCWMISRWFFFISIINQQNKIRKWFPWGFVFSGGFKHRNHPRFGSTSFAKRRQRLLRRDAPSNDAGIGCRLSRTQGALNMAWWCHVHPQWCEWEGF